MPGNLAIVVGKRPPLLTFWINVEMCVLMTEQLVSQSQ